MTSPSRSELKDPREYAAEDVCPRCVSGWPVCAPLPEGTPDWVRAAAHEASCARYVWTSDVCDACKAEMDADKPEVGRRCGECRLGLGTHDTADPLCNFHTQEIPS